MSDQCLHDIRDVAERHRERVENREARCSERCSPSRNLHVLGCPAMKRQFADALVAAYESEA